ncbi:MAG: PKD domain-containing protein [Streptosporangiaceae bacterium]
MSLLGLSLPATAMAGTASAGTPSVATALKAVLSLSAKSTTVGHTITASAAKSIVPSGDKLKKITLNWGDGSKTVTLASLKAKPSHHYTRVGRYTVRLTLTDRHKKTVHANATERVAAGSAAPPAGSYSGATSQGYGLVFYVSSSRKSLQDIAIPAVILDCTPGGASAESELSIAAAAISTSGSFTGTATQSGVWKGYPANFTYNFNGSFTTVNSAGELQAAGRFKETVKYNNGTAYTCTSNDLTWTATRDEQPAQTTSAPPAGSYSGATWQGYGLTFYVSSSRKSLQDIAIPAVILDCTPGGASADSELSIAAAAISSAGSFTGTATQSGVWKGYPAKFTYLFRGNFHSLSPAGVPRAAGTFKETISYNNGTAYTCNSDELTWTATRDNQPVQTTSPPPPGTYSGATWQGYGLTFDVSAGSTSLQNIAIPAVILDCTPGGATPDSELSIAAATISSTRSFTGTATQTGVFAGQPATFTYLFRGNFHSLNPDGVPRAAGTFKETVTYTNGVAYTCTSNELTWTALMSP